MPSRLDAYRRKRDFDKTPEPRGDAQPGRPHERLRFVVQKHAARRLHYDLRLEHEGVLHSWAVPKGPSLDPHERRLAIRTEDHPIEYADFEGVIPKQEYGGGTVLVWDRGYWSPEGEDIERSLRDGKLDFRLYGDKLRGRWTLVRMSPKDRRRKDGKDWLLIKRRDREARPPASAEIVASRPESVLSGREIEAVAAAHDRVWHADGGGETDPPKVRRIGRPDTVEGARRAPIPASPSPQLPTLADEVPAGPGWFHEPKLDGYRLLCRIDAGPAVALLTRRGNDWTDRFATIAEAARELPCEAALLDGEVVVFDRRGVTDFQKLQDAIGERDRDIVYVAFDLLHLDGWDLHEASLRARKELVRLLVAGAPAPIRYGDHLEGRGEAFFREACGLGLEGVVSKRADDPYRPERSRSWVKVKCRQRQELVVVGFTDPSGSRAGLGALLLATRDRPGAPLRYAGKVGTGFDERTLQRLGERLEPLVRREPAAAEAPQGKEARGVHWVEPELVAEVAFSDWTRAGRVRQASFCGLREDKPAREVVKEHSAASPGPGAPAQAGGTVRVAGVALSHPDKVLFPEVGITKRQLARYYEQVAELALPLLRNRPLTLLRCPDGRHRPCFVQKHLAPGSAAAIARVHVTQGEEPYAMVDELPALIGLVQLGVLELHAWGSRADHLEQPDLVVFDLDPSEELPWGPVVEGALELRKRLEALGLVTFVRVTGGKGLHIVVPLVPGPGWTSVKRFAQAMAKELAHDHPDRFTASLSKERRRGKIFIDYLRNARGATAIASYSVRAKPGAPVALPVAWDELEPRASEPPRYGALEVPELIRARARDPWEDFEDARRSVMP